jgi:hypothetical protein
MTNIQCGVQGPGSLEGRHEPEEDQRDCAGRGRAAGAGQCLEEGVAAKDAGGLSVRSRGTRAVRERRAVPSALGAQGGSLISENDFLAKKCEVLGIDLSEKP